MEVLVRSSSGKASTGKLRAQAPTPISCGDWDIVHIEPSAKEDKIQKGLAGYADEDSVTVVQRDRKEKGACRPQIVCQPEVADPGGPGGPKLQALGHQVAEVVQGVVNCPSPRDLSAYTIDIPEGPVGGTLGDRPWRPANVVSGISSAGGFPAPLVEVAARIHGRNVKALIDCGSTGNYINDSLVPALKMEVIPEKDFKVLELADKTTVKAQGYISFRLDSGEFSCRVIAWVFPNLRSEVIMGTPWLIKENPGIDWVKPEVKMRRRRQLQVSPLWRDRDSIDEADADKQEEKSARVNMCSAKAFKRYLRK